MKSSGVLNSKMLQKESLVGSDKLKERRARPKQITNVPSINAITVTVSSTTNQSSGSSSSTLPVSDVEQKRILIRKQLVILLHAVVCRRRDRAASVIQVCNVPFCGLMKDVLVHLNGCKDGRNCTYTHCASSRQILIHWKYCVKVECPVCVSLREVVPTSLLQVFPNPLCRAEIMKRVANQQRSENQQHDQAVPELMEFEE